MAENCNHDCASCSSNCASKGKESLLIPANALSDVKHVIGVVSGKGGVGKSIVTSMLAVLLQREGLKVGILDADITGPSIPKAFGMKNVEVYGDDNGMIPPSTTTGIDVMSVNLLLGDETKPVIWRGSIISGTVQQFWKDTIWNTDVLLVDCPPGTGDVPLTVFQTMPLDGIVIVSSPQDLVSMIVSKAANMADMMNIPVLGLIENMSYVKCPDCGKEIKVFGDSHIEEVAQRFNYDLLARIPMDPKLSALVDRGMIELMENDYMDNAAKTLMEKLGLAK
ncbi:MAG: Mrp/NBP35 family ATP-binding protein [Clostridia bacterium]|nr:Mrp/NBP35 family ATP-binding protein [Clostridia bacterium]